MGAEVTFLFILFLFPPNTLDNLCSYCTYDLDLLFTPELCYVSFLEFTMSGINYIGFNIDFCVDN